MRKKLSFWKILIVIAVSILVIELVFILVVTVVEKQKTLIEQEAILIQEITTEEESPTPEKPRLPESKGSFNDQLDAAINYLEQRQKWEEEMSKQVKLIKLPSKKDVPRFFIHQVTEMKKKDFIKSLKKREKKIETPILTQKEFLKKKNIPEFVKEQVKRIGTHGYYKAKMALSGLMGWGKGTYLNGEREKEFLWFSYTNTNAYQHFIFNMHFTEEHMKEINAAEDKNEAQAIEIDGAVNHTDAPYSTIVVFDEFDWHGPEGFVNNMIFRNQVLTLKINFLKGKFLFIKKMEVAQYLY